MTEEEVEALRINVRKSWIGCSTASLEQTLQFNKKLKQQVDTRIAVLEQLLDERKDNKSKQYAD